MNFKKYNLLILEYVFLVSHIKTFIYLRYMTKRRFKSEYLSNNFFLFNLNLNLIKKFIL